MNNAFTNIWMCALACGAMGGAAARGEITLIGRASIAGAALDKCPRTELLSGNVPQNRLGSFGSAIDYTGKDDVYVCCDDRGPGDGAAAFRPRMQTFRILIDTGASEAVKVELLGTTMLLNESGDALTGLASAFNEKDQRRGARFDPEGIRVGADGRVWISDEYGPWIDQFTMEGKRVRRVEIPAKFMAMHLGAEPEEELPPLNTKGRHPNNGFEGLAITPDKARLWAFVQSPLIQDGALSADGKKIGRNARVLEVTLATGKTREMVYEFSAAGMNVNEAIAVDDHRALVLERDGKKARVRGLWLADLSGASDVSEIAALPSEGLPEGVHAMKKTRWLDFMDPKFGLEAGMVEKIEGLAFGPRLADGRRTLIVTTDNDLKENEPSWFWVFVFGESDLGERGSGSAERGT